MTCPYSVYSTKAGICQTNLICCVTSRFEHMTSLQTLQKYLQDSQLFLSEGFGVFSDQIPIGDYLDNFLNLGFICLKIHQTSRSSQILSLLINCEMAKHFSNRAGSYTDLTLEFVTKHRNGQGEIK